MNRGASPVRPRPVVAVDGATTTAGTVCSSSSSSSSVKVAVRVRPLNRRELERGAQLAVCVPPSTAQVLAFKPADDSLKNAYIGLETRAADIEREARRFTFDHVYWSLRSGDPQPFMPAALAARGASLYNEYASQSQIYEDLGRDLLDHAFAGFNSTIMAYGQTGSGKSYTMMGTDADDEERGLIPRICSELFHRIRECQHQSEVAHNVEVSYMEIYCERVRDLLHAPALDGSRDGPPLKVREHPLIGPYVEGLAKLSVGSYEELRELMDQGNKARTVAATNMNETSSRSHAVFTIVLTQRQSIVGSDGVFTEKASRLCLVDLAGSERAVATGATGDRLKEGANINKSLTTLGKVISALADQASMPAPAASAPPLVSSSPAKRKGSQPLPFVPYRDSTLTWLLKDSLGGNAKLAVVATISPADINYEETVSTLRYADRAKSIVTKAIVNEDPTAKLIRELTEEVTRLRTLLNERGGSAITSLSAPIGTPVAADNAEVDLREQLQTAERLMAGLQETWEQKMQHSHEASVQRERALEDLGIMVHTQSGVVGLSSPRRTPHLVNLNEDPLMSECLLYPLRPGLTHVGKDATLIGIGNHIHLTGAAILPVHCHFDNVDGTVEVVPTSDEAMVVVNGQRITERRKLASGFRVLLGDHHIFRFNNPEEARRDREKMRTRRGVLDVVNADDSELFDDMESTVSSVNVDHDAAYQLRKEVALINDVFDSFAPDYILSSTPRADIDLNSMFTAVEKVNSMQQEESIKTEVIEEKIPSSILPSLPSTLPPVPIDSADDNAPQRRSNLALQDDIARKAITKWRTYRCTSLVEQILESTPLLKEANIIARELGKQINFHLCVMDALRMAAFMTRAFWDRPLTVGADDFSGNASCAMMSSKGGARGAQISIGIEVRRVDVDEEALVALWTLDEFKQRLVEMRSFYYRAGSEQAPGEASTTADLFGDTIPTNAFQHMGTAEVDMRNVAAGRQLQARAAVLSQHDGSVKGWLEVAIHPAGSLASATSSQLLEISIPQMEQVPTGCTRLHVQFRLSETSLSSSIDDRLYSSEPVEVVNKVATVAFQRTVRLSSAASILRIDVFGMGASTSHADVLPAVNEMTESFMRKFTPNTPESCTSQRSPMTQPPCLLPDKHDIYSALQICELSESGYYEPVPVFADSSFADVDPGVFSLRQGVQRRVSVALWHNSGEALPVRAITQMRVSRIRKCTRVGSELVYTGPEPNANDLTLRLSPAGHKLVVKTVDGRTFLGAEASWDSSLHESPLLDRVTISSGQSRPQTRVVATVSWYVDIEGFAEPLPFEMDVFLQVIPRGVKHAPDEVGGLFSGLFSSRALKQLGRVAAVFEVVETPNRVATPPYVGEEHVDTVRLRQCTVVRRQECLDHAASYVRGEEILNGWEPAGPWILFERQVLREKRDRAMEVERRRRMLASVGDMPRPAALGDNQDLLRRCLQLWRRPSIMGRGSQRPPISPVLTSLPPPPLMKTATARIVPKCPVVTHRGYLTLPERPGLTDDWVRRWFVIRRPYLYIYADRSEARELAVIGLSNVRTQWDLRVLEATTNRRNLFCVYTRRQAFVFQAESERDMFKWLAHLDPLQMSAAASNGRVLLM